MNTNEIAISIPQVAPDPSRPTAQNVKVPDTSVVIAYPCNGTIHVRFHRSVIGAMEYDRLQGWDNMLAEKAIVSGANISKARNELATWFLDETDGEWLWFIDTDMVFDPDTLPRLLCAAQVAGADVIGGLCCMIDDNDGPIPTIYQLGNFGAGEITRVVFDFDDNALMQVAATGGACLLVKREVLETIRAKVPTNPYPWFTETVINGNWVSEDIHFCLMANSAGHPVFVDCTTQIGHAKGQSVWYPRDVKTGRGFPDHKTYVVIPVKNKLEMTSSLLRQLREQGGYEKIIVVDNGSNSKMLNFLESQVQMGRGDMIVIRMPDAGIHEMWNAAVDFVIKQGQRRNVNVAFLNNDLKLGPDFIKRMVAGLRSEEDFVAVSGNYDNREIDGVQVVDDICANRYDGTGGLAGFAFMVRGEWFQSGYLFPTECKWWYGDNDLVLAARHANGRIGIVGNAEVEHIGGGGQTGGDWSQFGEQLEKDRIAFEKRWEEIARMSKNGPRTLEQMYEFVCETPSDINEHLPTLVKLIEETNAQNVIELGVRSGVSTIAWLFGISSTKGHVWSVDIDAPPQIQHPRWTFIRGNDLDPFVMKQLPDQAEIVFIDTVHTYDQTVAEIKAYIGKVAPGGCMVFHDSNHEKFDHHDADERPFPVRQAIVDMFEGDEPIRPVASIDSYENNHGLTVVWFE